MNPPPRPRSSPVNPGPVPAPRSAGADPPRAGDVLRLTREASVQFTTPILFRVIRVHDWPTYAGWVWLDGYQLDDAGEAVERRSIFVRAEGLHRISTPAPGPCTESGQSPGRRPPAPTDRPDRPRGAPDPNIL
jgi:hypothetical protein